MNTQGGCKMKLTHIKLRNASKGYYNDYIEAYDTNDIDSEIPEWLQKNIDDKTIICCGEVWLIKAPISSHTYSLLTGTGILYLDRDGGVSELFSLANATLRYYEKEYSL